MLDALGLEGVEVREWRIAPSMIDVYTFLEKKGKIPGFMNNKIKSYFPTWNIPYPTVDFHGSCRPWNWEVKRERVEVNLGEQFFGNKSINDYVKGLLATVSKLQPIYSIQDYVCTANKTFHDDDPPVVAMLPHTVHAMGLTLTLEPSIAKSRPIKNDNGEAVSKQLIMKYRVKIKYDNSFVGTEVKMGVEGTFHDVITIHAKDSKKPIDIIPGGD